jgi:hypothetical protein
MQNQDSSLSKGIQALVGCIPIFNAFVERAHLVEDLAESKRKLAALQE